MNLAQRVVFMICHVVVGHYCILGTNFRIALIWTARLIEIAGRLHEIAQDSDLDEQMADFSRDFERERDF